MDKVRNNIVANFSSQFVTVLLSLAAIPVYLRVLGVESYGLIGFYLSLQSIFSIFDFGLSAALSRELARYNHLDAAPALKRDLLKTLEGIYWPMGLLIAVVVFFASGPIASHWLKPVHLSTQQTTSAICLMGLATALQWPVTLYQGGFRGMERQVALNVVNTIVAMVRTGGSVLVLIYIAPTLEAFLYWQIATATIQTLLLRRMLWHILPRGPGAATFRRDLLLQLRSFGLGLTGISILTLLLVQSDRLILSSLLPLNEFGYYTLAASVAGSLASISGAFFFALFPRFSGLVSVGKAEALTALYHQSNQWLAVCVASIAAVVAIFSGGILLLWTHNPAIALNSAPILSLLVIGTALNGLVNLPYALQLAHGWTKLALYQNIVAVILLIPAIWWLAHRYGGVGAAAAWAALNLGYVLISMPIMHRRLLRGDLGIWYRQDILPPVLAAAAVAGAARLLFPTLPGGMLGILILAGTGAATLLGSALASSSIRSFVSHRLQPGAARSP